MINISSDYSFLAGAWHLAYYIPSNKPTGSLSRNIIEFKESNKPFVTAWSKWAADDLSTLPIHFDFILRALGSSELKVSETKGLDAMGKVLAEKLNSIYIPSVLAKNRVTPPMHTLKTKPERRAAIKDSYFVAKQPYDFDKKNILILDDVTTSSITIQEILRALKVVFPNAKYYLFCLGKTEYNSAANDTITQAYFNK